MENVSHVVGASSAAIAASGVTLEVTKFRPADKLSFVRKYEPDSAMIEGYRHAVIRYRVTGTNKVEKAAKMVTVPQMILDSDIYLIPEAAAKVLLGVLEDQEDAIIRAQLDEGKDVIKWETIGIDNSLAALTATRISNRLTKEMIENWCGVAIREHTDKRAAQISNEKNETGEIAAQRKAGTFNAYVRELSKLAAPVPNIGQQNAMQLANFLKVAGLADDIAKVLNAKLEAILHPVVAAGDL